MSWDTDGARIVDDDEARERAEEDLDGDYIQSGLDRANLVWTINAYAGEKLLLLARIATSGPEVCSLSIQRLARDCKMATRTVERYRSAFVADGVLERTVDSKDRTVFRINWRKVMVLACDGLERRPVKERVRIIEGTFRTIVDRNVLPINRDWLEHWADPATPQPPDTMPGHFTRSRRKKNATPRQGIHTARHGVGPPGRDVGSRAKPPDRVSGPSEPESTNPKGEPELCNGGALRPTRERRSSLGPIQAEYGGKPTVIVRALDLMRDGGGGFPWTRGDVAAELGV
jgi:hypothetical protein